MGQFWFGKIILQSLFDPHSFIDKFLKRKSWKPLQVRQVHMVLTSPDILQLTISPRAFVKLPGGLGQLWSRDPLCQTPCSATHCRVVRLPQTCVDIPGCAALHLNYRRITSDHSECKYCARARIMIKSRLKDSFTYSWLLAMAWIMSIIKLWPHGQSNFAQTQDFKQSNGFCHS